MSLAPPPWSLPPPGGPRHVAKLTMNYQRLNKTQLLALVKEKDDEISKLADRILDLEMTHEKRMESLKAELNYFMRDLLSVIKFVFELGVKTRKSLHSVQLPVLDPNQ